MLLNGEYGKAAAVFRENLLKWMVKQELGIHHIEKHYLMENKTNQLKIISKEFNQLAECPVWDDENQLLYWTDILKGRLYCYDFKKACVDILMEGKSVAGFTLNSGGGLICGCFAGIYSWEKEGGFKLITDKYEGEFLRVNDVIADARGRFIFGTNYYDPLKERQNPGKLYVMENDGSIRVLDEGYELSNGLGFSPDNEVLYSTDTATRKVYSFQYKLSEGTVSGKKLLIRVGDDEGAPDGLAVDKDGNIWSAQWYGGCVVRYDHEGRKTAIVKIPAKQVSSVTFGGKDLEYLFITTSGLNWKSPFSPPGYDYGGENIGGDVYQCLTGFKGLIRYKSRIGRQ
ncbi:MAG: SMP-30/gluconolactonase/LRE family protein [Ruminiclostridium sp.]|nr:SMP-30/gluconolactonase/LRE family protein [Ruminiclostridium sp.]